MNGKIKEGSYLPSIRSLAKDLKISVITTMKAYELLQEEGLVSAIQGKGYIVNPQDTEMMMEQQMRKVEAALSEAIKAADVAGITDQELIDTLQMLLKINREDV
jgi:GntR family transcriptional regulator